VDPNELLAATTLAVDGKSWSVEIMSLGSLRGVSPTILLTDLTDEINPTDPSDVPTFTFSPDVTLGVSVVLATPPRSDVRGVPAVVAQLVGCAVAEGNWTRLTDRNGEDPVYGEGTMLTFRDDLAIQVAEWQRDNDRRDAVAYGVMYGRGSLVEGVAVLPATTGPAYCWGQHDEIGQLTALMADFDPFQL
jgi:hypothetical protein